MSWDATWEDFYKAGGGNQYPEPAVVRFVFKYFSGSSSARRNTKILDLGSGRGSHLWFLAREGFDAHGIDASKSAVCAARNLLRSEHLTADILCGDFSELPFDSEYFDGIIDAASIQHNSIDAAKRILDEAYRVTKPGGFVFSMFLQSDRCLSASEFFTTRLEEENLRLLFEKFTIRDIDVHHYTENSQDSAITFSLVTAQKGEK